MYHQPQFILQGAKAHRTIKYTIPPGKKKADITFFLLSNIILDITLFIFI